MFSSSGSNLSKEENKNNHIKALPPYFIEIPPGARDMAFVETPIDEASPWIERTQTHQSYLSDSCPSRTKCIRLVLAGKMKRLVGVTVGSPLLKSRGYLQEQRGKRGLGKARRSKSTSEAQFMIFS